jgi:hypothetical protein
METNYMEVKYACRLNQPVKNANMPQVFRTTVDRRK